MNSEKLNEIRKNIDDYTAGELESLADTDPTLWDSVQKSTFIWAALSEKDFGVKYGTFLMRLKSLKNPYFVYNKYALTNKIGEFLLYAWEIGKVSINKNYLDPRALENSKLLLAQYNSGTDIFRNLVNQIYMVSDEVYDPKMDYKNTDYVPIIVLTDKGKYTVLADKNRKLLDMITYISYGANRSYSQIGKEIKSTSEAYLGYFGYGVEEDFYGALKLYYLR